MVALKQAKYVREDDADARAYLFYQHMRTVGLAETFYKNVQQDPGIFMSKGEVTRVSQNGGGLIVEADNTLLGEKIQVNADMEPAWSRSPRMTRLSTWPIARDPDSVTTTSSMNTRIRTISASPMKPNAPVFMPPAVFGAA
jgi:hypothetical protein